MRNSIRPQEFPKYTYSDYLNWDGQWEIIDGTVFAMAPLPSVRHQDINSAIVEQLRRETKKCAHCRAFMPLDWKINEETVVQPDALVICGNKKLKENFLDFAPSLLFEILSPATGMKDRNIKFRLYEQQKVKFYVIVDPKTKTAEVYELKKSKYILVLKTTKDKFVFGLSECSLEFSFKEIWE
jgi:Uma2 family endonuclease